MSTGLVTDARFRRHAGPADHPERPERLLAIEAALAEGGVDRACVRVAARAATRDELLAVHTEDHLARLDAEVATATRLAWLDGDTYYSPGSYEAARLAAGAAVELALAVGDGGLGGGAAFVRPPGHHATAARAMGFCLLNNVAVAAAALRRRGQRVAIVDYDVHHGNGTEAIFWDDPTVLYVSLHQSPLYPGSGPASALGGAHARGATVNVPLPAGADDVVYRAAFEEIVSPALVGFAPDVILLSAGFDAHEHDPLGSMRVTERGFAWMTHRLCDAVDGKVVAVLEGGYDLEGLGRSARAVVRVLLGDRVAAPEGRIDAAARAAIDGAIAAARGATA